jgi:hypothetical protein
MMKALLSLMALDSRSSGRRVMRYALLATLGSATLFSFLSNANAVHDEPSQTSQPSNAETITVVIDDEQTTLEATPKRTSKYWLGVILKNIEGDLAAYLGNVDGVLLDSVAPNGPAAQAGLVKGDVLLKINGDPLTEPGAVMAIMSRLAAKGEEAPVLNVVVLRKGEEREFAVQLEPRPKDSNPPGRPGRVELKPRPESDSHANPLAKAFSLSWTGENGEELQALLQQLGDGMMDQEMKLFRMGDPAMLVVPGNGASAFDSLQAVIKKVVDGREVQVTISRQSGEPAKITVKSDGETTEYTEEELDEMPAEIRSIVQPALQQTGKGIIRMSPMQLNLPGALNFKADELTLKASAEEARVMAERYREMAEKRASELKAKAEEMTSKARRQAVETLKEAQESVQKSRQANNAEVDELRKLIESLKAEVKELRQQLKDK